MNNYRPKILSVAKALPPFTRLTEDILPYVAKWIAHLPQRQQDKILRIFKYAKVNRRYSIMDIEEVFTRTSFADKNNQFAQKSVELAEQAFLTAIEQAGITKDQVHFIITTSCTKIMIPSLDAYLINKLHLRQDIVRLPVTEMGCAAGTSGLIYANEFLKSYPDKYAAVISIESPTTAFQHEDFSMTNIVSAAIFGDGAACAILGPSDEVKPTIIDTEMYHFYDAIDMMGYDIMDTGFKMVLDPTVPARIEKHFPEIIFPLLDRNCLTIDSLNHLIFHPGGKKIIQIVEELLDRYDKNIDDSQYILSEYGNMSSATVLYVMERFMKKNIPVDDWGLMLSFGPGFSAQRLLLRWTD